MTSSMELYGRIYADHVLIGDHNDQHFLLTQEEQAEALGWSEGCPEARKYILKPIDEGGRGVRGMSIRYGSLNFWVGFVRNKLIDEGKGQLATQLSEPKIRAEEEILGDHDKNWVPDDIHCKILQSFSSYVIPRLLTEYINEDTEKTRVSFSRTKQERMLKALKVLDEVIDGLGETQNIFDLVVNLTLGLINEKGRILVLLKNMLPKGKILEDGSEHDAREIYRKAMSKPVIKHAYNCFTILELERNGFVYFRD